MGLGSWARGALVEVWFWGEDRGVLFEGMGGEGGNGEVRCGDVFNLVWVGFLWLRAFEE